MNINLKLQLVVINSIIVITVLMLSTFLAINISRDSINDFSYKINSEMNTSLNINIINAANIAQNLVIDSHNNLLRDSKLIAETSLLTYALEYKIVPRGEPLNNPEGYIQKYRPIRPFVDYKLIAGKLKVDFYYSQNSITHIDIYDKNGNLLGATAGIPKYIIEKNPNIVKSILSSYEGHIDTLDIITSKNGLSFKVYQKVHKNWGLVGISSPINLAYLQNIKNITNTDIILYKGSQFLEGTLFKFDTEISSRKLVEEVEIFNEIKINKTIIITGSKIHPDKLIDLGVINNKKKIQKFRFAFIPLTNVSGKVVGMMGIARSLSILDQALESAKIESEQTYKRIINTFIIIAILSLISAMLLIYIYANSITKPISIILSTIYKVSQGNLNCESDIIRQDEIGKLSTGINKMITNLKEIETERFKRKKSDQLREINSNFSSILDKNKLLNSLYSKFLDYQEIEQGYILLMEKGSFDQFIFNRELLQIDFIKTVSISDFTNKFRKIINSVKAISSHDFKKSPLSHETINSLLSIPIILKNKLKGVIILESIKCSINKDNIEMLSEIASQAGAALENIEIFNQINRKTSELSFYYEKLKSIRDTVLTIYGERDKNLAIDFILKKLIELEPNYISCSYYEYRKSDNMLVCPSLSDSISLAKYPQLSEAFTKNIITDFTEKDSSFIKTKYALPIYYETRNFGIIMLEIDNSSDIYTDSKIDIINIITTNLSLYIENHTNQEMFFTSKNIDSLVNLVTGVAHEMNTPVGVCLTSASYISMLTDNIKDDYANNNMTKSHFIDYLENVSKNQQIVIKNLDRTRNLINSFKRIATTNIKKKKDKHNIKEILESLITIYKEILSKSDKNINMELLCKNDIILDFNSEIIMEIIEILFQNALIHGFDGIDKGKIIVSASEVKGSINIIFSDNGTGITGDNLSKIFDPFFTTKRGSNGTIGLGLNYAYNLVTNNLKGSIICESSISEGTSFIITFPVND